MCCPLAATGCAGTIHLVRLVDVTTKLRADLVPLRDQQWRLIGPDGKCCTLLDPPEELVDALRLRSHGFSNQLDDAMEQALADHQLLAHTSSGGRVMVIGGGLVAAEVALALAQAGVAVQVSAPEPSPVVIDPLGFHTSAAASIRSWVVERCPSARIEAAPHWTAITQAQTSLAVIATATVQPDRAITDHLARHWTPHLVARAHYDLATVGPLIDHNGPCLACLDLTQADHDPHWPTTLAALTTRPAQPTALAAHWAGVQSALEAIWFMQGAGTTLRASTIEIDAAHSGVARRRWSPHQDCACRCPSPLETPALPVAA